MINQSIWYYLCIAFCFTHVRIESWSTQSRSLKQGRGCQRFKQSISEHHKLWYWFSSPPAFNQCFLILIKSKSLYCSTFPLLLFICKRQVIHMLRFNSTGKAHRKPSRKLFLPLELEAWTSKEKRCCWIFFCVVLSRESLRIHTRCTQFFFLHSGFLLYSKVYWLNFKCHMRAELLHSDCMQYRPVVLNCLCYRTRYSLDIKWQYQECSSYKYKQKFVQMCNMSSYVEHYITTTLDVFMLIFSKKWGHVRESSYFSIYTNIARLWPKARIPFDMNQKNMLHRFSAFTISVEWTSAPFCVRN